MKNKRNNNQDAGKSGSNREKKSAASNDLPDSQHDRERLEPEETYIDLPDVKDIPGQEFINAPPMGMMSDTTISSDDEEGRSVFDRDDSEDLRTGNDADVSREERETLEQHDYMPSRDEDNLHRARMDNEDFENEPLNEGSFGSERPGRNNSNPGSEPEDRNETTA